ncbi:MAG TPA: hypothetical protein VGR35_00545 [Tepidisphaeraceae bacterium]|nr:hypothetical protein [Tepidisphaeraceae bacterium]
MLSWSPAKFIRDAAVRRAADVVNASGGAETKLQSLASILLSHVFNPRVQVTKLDDPYDPSTQNVRVLSRDEALASRTQREFPDESYGEVSDLAPQRPHDGDLAQIRRALESGGTRFLEILLQQWDNWARGESEYAPTVSAQELLKGGDND